MSQFKEANKVHKVEMGDTSEISSFRRGGEL